MLEYKSVPQLAAEPLPRHSTIASVYARTMHAHQLQDHFMHVCALKCIPHSPPHTLHPYVLTSWQSSGPDSRQESQTTASAAQGPAPKEESTVARKARGWMVQIDGKARNKLKVQAGGSVEGTEDDGQGMNELNALVPAQIQDS